MRNAYLLPLALLMASPALAQWDPANGDWGKDNPNHIRIMTWNVEDGLCSSNNKVEGLNNWTGLARIVAAMKPDILILQECGDNSGNGTGGGVDSTSNLRTTMNMFLGGGNDTFNGGSSITSWVQKYDATYDLPFKFISAETDNFNRNVIMSVFPFGDLNGDNDARYDDIPLILAADYAPGGDGGIRGFQFGELDLPDGTYAGDLVIGNAHLKAGGSGSDLSQRLEAAQNVAYFVEHWYNGAGTGTVDPDGKIFDSPPASNILDADTPVILGGDWNEDESSNGRKGPAQWLVQAEFASGDGTDKDQTDAIYDSATNFFTGSDATRASSKLDYISYQDSVVTLVREFVFNSAGLTGAQEPPEFAGASFPTLLSGFASDHFPVILDISVPTVVVNCPNDLDGDDAVGLSDLAIVLANFGISGATREDGDLSGDGTVGLEDLAAILADFGCL